MPQHERSFEMDLEDAEEPGVHQLGVRFTTDGRDVVAFMVQQYEAFVDGDWRRVVRYDTAHEQLHRHHFDAAGNEVYKRWLGTTPPYNEALTAALDDLEQNWPRYYRLLMSTGDIRR